MKTALIIFIISIISGLLSQRAISRFMEDRIKQWSWEYQIFGFFGLIICVFGLIYSVGYLLGYVAEMIL